MKEMCYIFNTQLILRLKRETNLAKRGLFAELSADLSAGRRRSWIWSHFELKDGSARCRICSENLQACKGGSTGNMHRHMSAKHPEVFKPTLTHSSMTALSGNELYISALPQFFFPRIYVNYTWSVFQLSSKSIIQHLLLNDKFTSKVLEVRFSMYLCLNSQNLY